MNSLSFAPAPDPGPALILLCTTLIIVLLGMFWIAMAVRVVPEYQRLVVFRLGRALGTRGPGLVLLIPAIDRGIKVDLREQERTIPGQSFLSADKYPAKLDIRWRYKITDPLNSVMQVGNFETAAQEQIAASLRSAIGKLNGRDVLEGRERLAEEACLELNAAAAKWGVQATRLEIGEVNLPRAVQDDVHSGRTRQAALVGSVGEAKSSIYTEGSLEMFGETWNASSARPIAPGRKVRVSRVVLEVEEL